MRKCRWRGDGSSREGGGVSETLKKYNGGGVIKMLSVYIRSGVTFFRGKSGAN